METNLNLPSSGPESPVSSVGPKKSKTILIVTAVLVFCLIAGSAYAYFALDFFKSSKQIYLEAEAKQLVEVNNSLNKALDDYNTNMKVLQETPVHSNVELSAKVSGVNLPAGSSDQLTIDLLNKTKFIIESSSDQKNQKFYNKLNIALEGNNLLGIESFVDSEKIGFGVPAIYNKYGIMEFKDREKLMTRYNLQAWPKKLVRTEDTLELFKLSAQEKLLLLEYGKLYVDSLDEKKLTLKPGTFSAEGIKIEVREITVTYTESEFKALIKQIANKMATDSRTIDLIYAKRQKLNQLLEDSGQPSLGAMDKPQLTKVLAQANTDFLKELASWQLPQGVKMKLLVDAADNILERTITSGKAEELVTYRTAKWVDQAGQTKTECSLTAKSGNATLELKLAHSYQQPDSKSQKGKLSFTAQETADNKQTNLFKLENDYNLTKVDNRAELVNAFKVAFEDEYDKQKMAGDIKLSSTKNDKEKTRDTEMTTKLKIDLPDQQQVVVDILLKGQEKFGAAVKLPVLTADNTVDLADVTDEQLNVIYQEIQKGVFEFTTRNAELFQPLLGGLY